MKIISLGWGVEGGAEVNEYMTLKEHYDLVKKKQEDERYVGLAHDLFRMIEKSRFTIPPPCQPQAGDD